MESIPFFYFDGDEGCDECEAMTGYYSEEPSRPHENCDCEIMAAFLEGETEFREHMEGESEYEVDGVDYFDFFWEGADDTDVTWPLSEDISVTLTGDTSVEEEIEEAFEVSSNYEEEETFTETFEAELEPGGGVIVEAIGIYNHIEFGVEVWFVSDEESEDGERVEIFLHMAGDDIDVPVGIRLEAEEIGPPDVVD